MLFLLTAMAGLGIVIWKLPQIRPDTLLLVVFTFFFIWLARRQKRHDPYLDNHRLAEAFRIRIFWRLAGIRKCIFDYFGGNDLLGRRIFGNCETADLLGFGENLREDSLVLSQWLKKQRDWYGEKSRKLKKMDRYWCRGLAAGLSILFLIGGLCFGDKDHSDWAWNCVSLGMFLFLCTRFVRRKGAWKKIAAEYDDARENFGFACRNFDEFTLAERQYMILRLGERTLRENARWRNLHKQARRT